jgi:hypothetical protein
LADTSVMEHRAARASKSIQRYFMVDNALVIWTLAIDEMKTQVD